MPHYTCTGECQGISMQPGNCQTQDCSKKSQPLTECDCTDGEHAELKEKQEPEEDQATLTEGDKPE